MNGSLTEIQAALATAGAPSVLSDILFDTSDMVRSLVPEMEKLKDYHTVWQMPDSLSPLRTILSEIEDNLLYNWFEVSLDCNIQIGTYRFSKRKHELSYSKTMLDRALAVCVDGANAGVDKLLIALSETMREKVKELSERWFKSPEDGKMDGEGKHLMELLFPDMEEFVEAMIKCVDAEAIGIVEDLPDNSSMGDDVLATIEKWRTEDSVPLKERRRAFFTRKMRMLHKEMKALRDVGNVNDLEMETQTLLDHVARVPLVMPKHFYDFTFYLVFPKYQPDRASEMKKPKVASLKYWPAGSSVDKASVVKMKDIVLKNGGEETNMAATLASRMFQDTGDSSIDSDDEDDPRNKWQSYPSREWRGFLCTAQCALDCTYCFHFVLDGVLFLDFDSYQRSTNHESGECRQVRFSAHARPYTINPLRHVGLVL